MRCSGRHLSSRRLQPEQAARRQALIAGVRSVELQSLAESDFGDFWRRALATLIDLAILWIPMTLAEFALQLWIDKSNPETEEASFLVQLIAVYGVWAIYEVPFWLTPWQATPGKRICGLAVTDIRGERLSLVHALARYGAKIVSGAIVVGVFFVFFTRWRQALHDLIAKTVVLKRVALPQFART